MADQGISTAVREQKTPSVTSERECGMGPHDHVCEDSDVGVSGPFDFSPAEHDAFCALWENVVWDIVPRCHGRVARPDEIVTRFIPDPFEAGVFMRRMVAEPFSLLKLAFYHATSRHTGATYETASRQRWSNIAMRVRLDRKLAVPPTEEEGLRATLDKYRRNLEALIEERTSLQAQHDGMQDEHRERMADIDEQIRGEQEAIRKLEGRLGQTPFSSQ